jgi:hypothetical protein
MPLILTILPIWAGLLSAADPRYPLPYPPALPGGKAFATDQSADFLKPPAGFREGVAVAGTPPVIDFLYFPGQDHAGGPWSVWGDGSAAGDCYYSAIGDHLSPRGTALVFEYNSLRKSFRLLADVRKFLESSGALPPGSDYTPGKIHGRIDLGKDGWLYYSTHRGSPRTTNDAHGYRGDWILRTHPQSGKTEIVAAHPVEKHAIPMSILDPERLVFYGGTAPGEDAALKEVRFFAYDLAQRKIVFTSGGGPARAAIFSRTTGRIYWDGKRWDPAEGRISPCPEVPAVRSATEETPKGIIYGTSERSAELWAFDARSEKVSTLGTGAVGREEYITSIDADPTGRYLYYVPGAHGGAAADGTPVVQFDVTRRTRKVIAFLHPHYSEKYGYTPDGTFSSTLDPKGEKLYVTFNGMRRGQPRFWESCALAVIHIPASERAAASGHSVPITPRARG